ncbi:MAG: class I SAM-dependent methyltransferase [Bacteriovoracaceae bacterium]|nr:class I SAM-dependent methyltransferase [Bacteriovoracaceae bacterium]
MAQEIEEFKFGELVHDSLLYDKLNDFDYDLPFYESWCKKANGPVLELCCGTGRLTIPLAQKGIDITGIDYTDAMLKAAHKKAKRHNLEIEFLKQDMRSFEVNKLFKLIFIPFNSLQCLVDFRDVEQVFTNVKKHLGPGGVFIIDIFNPNIQYIVEGTGTPVEKYRFSLGDGRHVVIKETCCYNAKFQVNNVTWQHQISGKKSDQQLPMRCFYPLEMEALLYYNGLKMIDRFGDFDESPFSSNSPKQIIVAEV